jgi:hypothetical protein
MFEDSSSHPAVIEIVEGPGRGMKGVKSSYIDPLRSYIASGVTMFLQIDDPRTFEEMR